MDLSIIDFYSLIMRGRPLCSKDRHLLKKYKITQSQANEMESILSGFFFLNVIK